MGKVIDIRSSRPVRTLRGASGIRLPHDSKSPHVEKARGLSSNLLPFLQQLRLGDYFEIIESWRAKEKLSFRTDDLLLNLIHKKEVTNPPGLLALLTDPKGLEERTRKLEPSRKAQKEWLCVSPHALVENPPNQTSAEADTIVLRAISDPAFARYLWTFLSLGSPFFQSSLVRWFEKSTRANSKKRVLNLLADLQIPILSATVSNRFADAFEVGEELSQFMSDDPDFAGYLLDAKTPADLELLIGQIQAQNYAIRQAIRDSRDLNYLIANFFPFPLAYQYRLLGGLSHPHDLLREQFRFAEGMLAFLGSVALSQFERAPTKIASILRERPGLTMGDWLTLLRTAVKSPPSNEAGDLPGKLALCFQSEGPTKLSECASRLLQLRNDYAHGRLDVSTSAGVTEEIRSLIDHCMNELVFLIHHPIFRVISVAPVRPRGSRFIHTIHEHSGDNPVHKQHLFEFDDPLPHGAYIQTELGPKDLDPFISIRTCSRCAAPETYSIDRRGKNPGEWLLKSFERGHESGPVDLSAWLGES